MKVKFIVELSADTKVGYLIALREAIAEHISQIQLRQVKAHEIIIKVSDD